MSGLADGEVETALEMSIALHGREVTSAELVERALSRAEQRHLDWLTWGLLPHATEPPDGGPRPIHARAETVAELPLFADAFRQRRAARWTYLRAS